MIPLERNFFSPRWWIQFLHETRYAHFFIVGVTGVAINLGITAFFTEFIFGRENYYSGYLLGLSANLLYNFILHTRVTFKTKEGHVRRMVLFTLYSLALAYVQAQTVKILTNIVGVNWYIVVIASVIFFFSIVTFLTFKFVLFRQPEEVL